MAKKKLKVKIVDKQDLNSTIIEQILKNLQGRYLIRLPGGKKILIDFDRVYKKEEITPFVTELMGSMYIEKKADQLGEDGSVLIDLLAKNGNIEHLLLKFLKENDPSFASEEASDEQMIEEFRHTSFKEALNAGIIKHVAGGYKITSDIIYVSLNVKTTLPFVRAFRRLPS